MDKESKYYVSNDKHRRNLNKLVEIYETKHRQNPWVCHRYGIHFCISDLVELYLHLTRKFLPAALYNNLSDAEKARFEALNFNNWSAAEQRGIVEVTFNVANLSKQQLRSGPTAILTIVKNFLMELATDKFLDL